MNNNYQVIHAFADGCRWWHRLTVRLLIPDKVYFHYLFVGVPVRIIRYLPLRPYMNNAGFMR